MSEVELVWRRYWSALMLARDVHTLKSIVIGRPVLAGRLDAEVLRRALRGEPLPPAEEFIRIRHGHLDAVAEAGPPLPTTTKGGEAA